MTCGSRAASLASPSISGGRLPLGLPVPGRRSSRSPRGYEGRHGCRLALWSGPAPAQAGLAIAKGSRDLRLARWDSEGRHYVLLSETVPTERFALLAEAAVLLTAPDMTDRLRIALDRATGLLERPCAG